MPQFELEPAPDGVTRIVVRGEVMDPPDALALYDTLCHAVEGGAKRLEVNLGEVELMSSAGISALVRAQHASARVQCALQVVAASDMVRRVLGITEVDRLVDLPPADR